MANLRVTCDSITLRGKRVARGHVVPKGLFGNNATWKSLVATGRLEETDDPVGAPEKPERKKRAK